MRCDSRTMRIQIKHGATTNDLIKFFALKNEKELKNLIETLFGSGSRKVLYDIKHNNHIATKHSANESKTVAKVDSTPKISKKSDDDDEANTIVEATTKPLSEDEIMLSLKKNEDEMSIHLMELERIHYTYVNERVDIVKKLAGQKEVFLKLQQLLKENKDKTSELFEQYNSIRSKMDENIEEQKVVRILLDEVRKKIKDMSIVNVFIYRNGSIEFEPAVQFEPVSQEKVNELFSQLVIMPEADYLNVVEVKALAKLAVKLNKNDLNCSYIFENPAAEKLFEKTKALTK